jgi:hypothetical protein
MKLVVAADVMAVRSKSSIFRVIRESEFLRWMQRVSPYLRSQGRFTRDGPADPEPRHLVEQRGARQTKLCSRTFHTAHHPTTVFKRTQDRSAFDLL